ncbi:hypothetical protein CRYUN_Cryun01aG0126600 [Craigia yunnanensis]
MSSYQGVIVSDPWLQSQFTQVELRTLKSKFVSVRTQRGRVTVGDLPPAFAKLKAFSEMFNENEIRTILGESNSDMGEEIDFEAFLRAYLNLQGRANAKSGGSKSSFLKATTTTVHHVNESEKASYVAHINSFLAEDKFLKSFLPIDPATNALFDLAKNGVLLCKLINIAVPGTIDERAINTKKPHLVLGLNSQIIKIQLLADLNLRKTPQLVELVDDSKDLEELLGLAPEKVLLKWMNFHLKKVGHEKQITNFSSDLKDGEAYAYLLNALAPEHSIPSTLDTKDPTERANMVLQQAEKLDCKRYLTPKDIVEGSPNLNLAFVAQIFQHRNGLSTDSKNMSFAKMMIDDAQTSREERCFRLWINSLGSCYMGSVRVNWKHANKPPIKMPFKKVENCNQVIKIGKELNFSCVNELAMMLCKETRNLYLNFCHLFLIVNDGIVIRGYGVNTQYFLRQFNKHKNNKFQALKQSKLQQSYPLD